MPKKIFDVIPPSEPRSPRFERRKRPAFPKRRSWFASLGGRSNQVKEKSRPKIRVGERLSNTFKGKRIFLKILIPFLLIMILIGVFGYSAFSKTEIIIWPEVDTLNFKETISIDSETEHPDFTARVLPGKIFKDQKSNSQDFPSSGEILKEGKASGIIRVYNNYHLSQTLVANTRFQPPLEAFQPSLEKGESPWFRTTERINIPPKSHKEVRVVADNPGEKYNIKPSKFSVPGLKGLAQYTLVYGESFQEFEGGFKGEVAQVSQADLDKARDILTEKTEKESRDFLKTVIPLDFILIDEIISQETVEENYSVGAGEAAEFFNFQVKIKSQGLSFKESDIESFAKDIINLNTSEDKKLQEESLEINYSLESMDMESGKATLNLEIGAKVYSDIDLTELKKALLGRSFKEAQIFLENQPQVTKVEIKSWSFWRKKIPENINKVEIRLNLD